MPLRIPVRAAGAAKSWNAASTHFLKAGNDALFPRIPDRLGGGIDRSRWRKFYSSSTRASCRVDGGGSRRHGLLVRRRAAPDRRSFLSGGKTHSLALFVASASGSSARTPGGHMGAAIFEPGWGKPGRIFLLGHYFA